MTDRLTKQIVNDIADDIASRGLEDFISLSEVVSRIRENARLYEVALTDGEAVEWTKEVVKFLLDSGLVIAGTLDETGEFTSRELGAQSVIEYLRRHWSGFESDSPDMTDLWFLWFADTQEGSVRGTRVRDEVNRRFKWEPAD